MEKALNSKVFKPTQVCCPSDIQVHLHNKCGLTSHYALISEILRWWASAGKWLLTCFRPEKQDSSLREQGHLTKSDELLCKRQVTQGLESLLNKIQRHVLKWVPQMVSASHPETSLRKQVTKGVRESPLQTPRVYSQLRITEFSSHERNTQMRSLP